jgi:tRNA A-37 threonylcarbamoyl transferase component Bud32
VVGTSYRFLAHLKVGGQGSVYRATDSFGGDYVAKELLTVGLTPQEVATARQRFADEAGLLRSLRHAAIPRVVDAFEWNGRSFLVMDRIEGEDLDARLRRLATGKGFGERVVQEWALQLCDVLAYLHHRPQPVIFRDLKPANIMVDPAGQIHLVDFGIARLFAARTQGTLIGTPGYAAPEQYQGLAPTPATDQYGLGATLHHLLSGTNPDDYQGRVGQPFIFDFSRVPAAWQPILRRMLALLPMQRYPSIAEVRAAMAGISVPQTGQTRMLTGLAPSGALAFTNPFLVVPGGTCEIAQYPLTNGEYAAYVAATGRTAPSHWNGPLPPAGLEHHPVTHVSHDDAQAYCVWAHVRLPSESEWMLAASGGDGRRYPWGNAFESRGNFTPPATTPVTQFPEGKAPCGATDLVGNAWEWTATLTPEGQAVCKGGSFYGAKPIKDRGTQNKATRAPFIGFRVCR